MIFCPMSANALPMISLDMQVLKIVLAQVLLVLASVIYLTVFLATYSVEAFAVADNVSIVAQICVMTWN